MYSLDLKTVDKVVYHRENSSVQAKVGHDDTGKSGRTELVLALKLISSDSKRQKQAVGIWKMRENFLRNCKIGERSSASFLSRMVTHPDRAVN